MAGKGKSKAAVGASNEVTGTVLVVGGCGFLGRHIVEYILNKSPHWNVHVKVLDRVLPADPTYRHDRLEFVQGDICDLADVEKACKGARIVIHTASPPHGLGKKVYQAVNVDGTKNILTACITQHVPYFVFTSTASVVFEGKHIHNGDETLPYAKTIIDPYIETKIDAEKIVLEYNGKPLEGEPANDVDPSELRTVALRPSGIFGPRDAQAWPGFIDAAKEGKSKYLLGDGSNKMDWTYVENLAYAHLVAAEKLLESAPNVAGEAFFITNDEPIPFWDMAKYIWKNLGYPQPSITIPVFLVYYIAILIDFICLLLSPIKTIHPTLSYFRVVNATAHRYFSMEKAKKYLGYQPPISLKEGMERTLEHYKKNLPHMAHPTKQLEWQEEAKNE